MAALCVAVGLTGLTAAAPAGAFDSSPQRKPRCRPARSRVLQMRGSPTRRPNIIVVSPPPSAGLVHSPLDLKLQFHAFGGGEIDPGSVVVTYLKQPAIDITQRITPFITADGVDIPQAEVPPGKHQFWVELKDKSGRIGGAEFDFQVAK